VERDVQRSDGNVESLEATEVLGNPARQRDAPRQHPDDGKVIQRGGASFEDLVRDAAERTVDPVRCEQLRVRVLVYA
jgi:hypothetical protein